MVYIKHWAEFHSRALELHEAEPQRTRYLIKAHPSRQWLVLKVTDDSTTLKFRSRSTVILNRFELLNRELTARMAALAEAAPTAADVTADHQHASQGIVNEASAQTQAAGGAGAGGAGVGGGGGGGGAAKKKKKGKGGKK